MMRWQPFTELMSLRQAMDKLFEDSFVTPSRLLSAFGPVPTTPIDMYHTANEVVIKATLPGGLDSDKAEASFENGILTLTIPKSEQVKPKQIKVKAKGVIEGQK